MTIENEVKNKRKHETESTDEENANEFKKIHLEKKKKKKDKAEKFEKIEKDKNNKRDKKKKEKKEKGKEKSNKEKEKATGEANKSNNDTNDITTSLNAQPVAPFSIPQSVIDSFTKEHNIDISGDSTFQPILEFSQTGFSDDLLKAVKGFSKPTPIQSCCWPICMSGRDVIGIAETGSGKTLAFALPAFMRIKADRLRNSKHKNPTVLILAPTRELAMQSQEQCEAVGKECMIRSVCIYGGGSRADQTNALKRGVDIIVATPGRLMDLMSEGVCDVSEVTYMVLDEADRMLDTGFEETVRQIIGKTKRGRQTVMFSATWPESVRRLAQDFLINPTKVTIGSLDLAASHNVKQVVEVLDPITKDQRLIHLLNQYHKSRKNKVLIFVLYKKEATRVEQMLQRKGFTVIAIHGDKNQSQRTEALNMFKNGTYPLMIATDVAARGLDIDVETVLNFTFPLTIEDYVHRIGRTGRAGKKGISHTFFTVHDKTHSGELINVLKEAGQEVPADLLKFGSTIKKKEHKSYGAFYKEVDPNVKSTKIVFADADD